MTPRPYSFRVEYREPEFPGRQITADVVFANAETRAAYLAALRTGART